MKMPIGSLSTEIATEINIPQERVLAAVKSIISGIDHALAHEEQLGIIRTERGILMPNLPEEGLVVLVSSGSGLRPSLAQEMISIFEQRIIQGLNEADAVEIEELGTFRKLFAQERVDRNSPLEFRPLPGPEIP